MKVAYYIGSLNRGGTEMLTLDICKRHSWAPFEILLVYRNEGELSEAFHETGVKMHRLKPQRGHFLRYMLQMRRLLQRENVDVLHAQTLMNGVTAVFFLMFTRIRLITTFHGFFYGLLPVIFRHIVMWGSDATLYVSEYARQWYVSHSWCNSKKCHTVYNGVNFKKIDFAIPCPDFPHDGRIKLAMVGNFVGGRSQSVIVRSIHALKERGECGFDFYFIGKRAEKEPWLYDDCLKYCETHQLYNVHFLGGRNDVPSLLKSMNGFVYSTVNDTFGIAVIEAMASGLPVVVNDWQVMKEVCSMPDEIHQQDMGVWFFRSGDIRDCADHIQDLLATVRCKSEALCVQCSRQAEWIRRRYSIERHIKNLEQVYVRNIR